MDGSAVTQALMGMAGGGAPPGQGPAGAQGPPSAAPPGGGAPPTGGPPGAGGGQPDPQELVKHRLLALFMGLSSMGLQETANDIVQRLRKRMERLQKSSPQGRQGAAANSALPGSSGGPPGVGPMPGSPGV